MSVGLLRSCHLLDGRFTVTRTLPRTLLGLVTEKLFGLIIFELRAAEHYQ